MGEVKDMKKNFFLVVLFILGISVWAWGASPDSYFPMKDGMRWEYQFKVLDLKSQNSIGTGKSIKKNLAPVELKGSNVVPQVYSFYEPANVLKQETTSYVAKDAGGFSVLARKGSSDKEPKILPEKYYVLKFPLTKGASWKQEVEGFLLQDTVEATDASVQVPAGTYSNCLMIKKLYFNPKNPSTPVKETDFWFAPDVGNVKVAIKNPQENKEIVQELVSFKK
jgi:hypothetical protein